MTANYSLHILDGDWIRSTPGPSIEDVSDDVMHDDISLGQSSIDWVFQFRTDALHYLTNGESGPEGGYAEWDGSDCYMGFISVEATADIGTLLSAISPDELMDAATWIEDDVKEDIARNLKNHYPDLKRFIDKAVAAGNGLACLAVN